LASTDAHMRRLAPLVVAFFYLFSAFPVSASVAGTASGGSVGLPGGGPAQAAQNASEPILPDSISLGYDVTGMAYDPTTNRLYVGMTSPSFSAGGSVVMIDAGSNTVLGQIKLYAVGDLALVPSQHLLYVGDGTYMDGMFAINTTTDQVVGHVSNLERSLHFAVDTKRNRVYTATVSADIIETTFDGRNFTQRAIQVAPTVGDRFNIAVNPTTGVVYAVRTQDSLLYAVDPSSGTVTTFPMANVSSTSYWPGIAVDPGSNTVFIARQGDNVFSANLAVVDASTGTPLSPSVALPSDVVADSLTLNPVRSLAYLGESGNSTAVVDTSTDALLGSMALPDHPSVLTPNSVSGEVYVANAATMSLSEWNPDLTQQVSISPQSVPTISGGDQECCRVANGLIPMLNPQGVAYDEENDRAYMADADSNVVEVYDGSLRTFVANISVPNPVWMAVVPSSHHLYVSGGTYSRDTYVIDTNTDAVVGRISNLARTYGMAANTGTGQVYMVVNEASTSQILEVSPAGVNFTQRLITVDQKSLLSSASMAVDPGTGVVYVLGETYPLGFVYAVNPRTGGVTRVEVGVEPSSLAVNPNTHEVYLAGRVESVTDLLVMSGVTDRLLPEFVDLNAVFAGQMVYDSANDKIYLFHQGDQFSNDRIRFSDHVTAIAAATLAFAGTVGLPDHPSMAAVNTRTGDLIVGVSGTLDQGVLTVATSPAALPGEAVSRPLLSAVDNFPPGIQAGGHFGIFYDRVTLQNIGTADGTFLLSTFFIPGIIYSTNIVTPFPDVQLVHFEQGAIVYSVTVPALSTEYVDIPIRLDPAAVNFGGGSPGQGQLYAPGDLFQLGLTIQLATLSPSEWSQIKSGYRDTGAIDQAMIVSFDDEAVFEASLYPAMPTLCLGTVTSGCVDTASVNATYQAAFDRLWTTYQVAPGLANYLAYKISDRNLRQAISLDASLALPDPPSTSDQPSWGELVNHASPELKSHLFSCLFQEMMKGWLQEMLADPINDATYGILDLHFQGDDKFVAWGRWIAVGGEVAVGGLKVLGPKIESALSQTEAANKVRDVLNSGLDYASTQVLSRVPSTGWGFDGVISQGERIIQVADNHASWTVGNLNVPQFPSISTESDWQKDWPFFSWPGASGFVDNSFQFPDITGPLSQLGMTNPTFTAPSLSQVVDALSYARDEVNNALNTVLNAPFDDDCSQLLSGQDPNEMYAYPSGYVRESQVASIPTVVRFGIDFENLANATGVANNIRVVTTIGPSLNLSTFTPIAVSHPDKLANVTVDSATRQITWYFENISLPPDMAPPAGDGWVKYAIDANGNLPSGTTIASRASVYFDYNPPVITNTVEQIVDNDPPVTHVSPLPASTSETSLDVGWNGTDTGSGIASTLIFVSRDNMSNFRPLNFTGVQTAHFVGQPGHTYYFVSLAVDNAGNIEAKTRADAVVTIQSPFNYLLLLLPVAAVAALVAVVFYFRRKPKKGRQPKDFTGAGRKPRKRICASGLSP
jgi:hypothetical protein